MSNNKEMINYIIFGILTTIVNIFVFQICNQFISLLLISNLIAWFVSIVFAYVTNALYVFSEKQSISIKQFVSFMISRILTLVIETLVLWILLDYLLVSSLIAKIISNIIVIILNFVLSKYIVFKK